MKTWIKNYENGSALSLYIQPGASRSEISGLHGERLKVKIKAPPRDGEANEALIEFFAEILGLGKSKVDIIQGESSRQKVIWVALPPEKVVILLGSLAESCKQ